MEERSVHTGKVAGSIPAGTTKKTASSLAVFHVQLTPHSPPSDHELAQAKELSLELRGILQALGVRHCAWESGPFSKWCTWKVVASVGLSQSREVWASRYDLRGINFTVNDVVVLLDLGEVCGVAKARSLKQLA